MPRPNVSAAPDTDALGEPVGQGIGKLVAATGSAVGTVTEEYKREKDKATQARVDAAELEWAQEASLQMYDKDKGFTRQQGINALNTKPLKDALRGKYDKLSSALPDDQARELFKSRIEPRMLATNQTAQQHAGREFDIYRKANTNALAATHLDGLGKNGAAMTPEAIEGEIKAGTERLVTQAHDVEGAGLAEIESLRANYRSTAQEQVIDSFLNTKNVEGAKAYLEKVQDQLGPKADSVKHKVNTAYEAYQTEVLGREIANIALDPDSKLINEDVANELVGKLPPGALREKAAQDVKQRVSEASSAHTARGKALYAEALSYMQTGGYYLHNIPPELTAQLTDKKAGFNPYYEQLRFQTLRYQKELAGQGPTTNEVAAQAALAQDMTDYADKYATMSAEDFVSSPLVRALPLKEQERSVAQFRAAHATGAKPFTFTEPEVKRLIEVGRDSEIFPGKGAGNDPTKWSPDQATLFNRARQRILDKGAFYRKQHGKDPDEKTVDGWLGEALSSKELPKTGPMGLDIMNKHTTPALLDISDEDYDRVVKRFREKKGVDPSAAQIKAVLDKERGMQGNSGAK